MDEGKALSHRWPPAQRLVSKQKAGWCESTAAYSHHPAIRQGFRNPTRSPHLGWKHLALAHTSKGAHVSIYLSAVTPQARDYSSFRRSPSLDS
ncbi:hypothetical protein HMPREF0043_01467 [Actinobaculum sp. oral taxon 183 str. F0552]|nr:hypothetical protein HMPREF0043_01467 [Actinobaculum sp. oral taxon 183 str. F0552]